MRAFVIVAGVLTALTGYALYASSAAAGSQDNRAADRVAIEKLHQQDISGTLSRDALVLGAMWTEDAIRLGAGAPAEVGGEAIRASVERQTANRALKVLSYAPESRDLTFLDGGWAVEWRSYTASFVNSPGSDVVQVRGSTLAVYKKLPDGSWKVFRAMGAPDSM